MQPMSPYLSAGSKRLLDLSFTLLISPFAIIAFLLGVLLVFLTSGRPVFFKQERVGMDGNAFIMFKIRTLRNGFSSKPGSEHAANDITLIGQFLRKTRIDEIPQILNILKGEMSWVGPRPEVAFYYERFQSLDARFEGRLRAKPGITGLAQINNPNATPSENLEKLEFDLKYIEGANFGLDVKILIKSFMVIW